MVPSGDTAVAVTLDTDDLGSFGMGGKLDTDNFLEAGPLTTPGLRPDGDLDTEGLGELEDDDFDMLPSFFVLLIVNLRPPVEGLTAYSVFFSPSFLLSVPSPFEESFWLLSFFSMMVTVSEVLPAPTLSLSTMSDRLGPFLFFGGEAFALSMEKTGGLSSREAGAVWGWVAARMEEASEAEEAVSPVDTLVMVRASLSPFFIFSLTNEVLEEEEEFEDEEDEDDDEEDTFGLVAVELEDEEEEDVVEDEDDVVMGVVVVVVVVEVVVVVVVVTFAAVTVTDDDDTGNEDDDDDKVVEVDDDNDDDDDNDEDEIDEEAEMEVEEVVDDDDEVDEGIEDEEEELELPGREGLELELLSFSLVLSFGEREGLEKVGDADLS